MNEELCQFDANLKELFMDSKIEEMKELLKEKPDDMVKEIFEYHWNTIKKYYNSEKYALLFQHFTYVAYSCLIVEYAYQRKLIRDDVFEIMMSIFNDIYELKRRERENNS